MVAAKGLMLCCRLTKQCLHKVRRRAGRSRKPSCARHRSGRQPGFTQTRQQWQMRGQEDRWFEQTQHHQARRAMAPVQHRLSGEPPRQWGRRLMLRWITRRGAAGWRESEFECYGDDWHTHTHLVNLKSRDAKSECEGVATSSQITLWNQIT